MFPEGDRSMARRLSELWRNNSVATGKRTLGCEAHTRNNLEEVAAISAVYTRYATF